MLEHKSEISHILEKIIIIFLFINPFIDIITGIYFKEVLGATTLSLFAGEYSFSPGLYPRLAMLAVYTVYLLMKKDKPAVFTLVVVGAAWVLSTAVLLMSGVELTLSVDIKNIVKFCYNLVVFFVFIQIFKSMYSDKDVLIEKVNFFLKYTYLIYAFGVIIPYLFGLGFSTYADRFGYRGTRGYFFSGNDVTAVLFMFLPYLIACFLDGKEGSKDYLGLLAPGSAIVALMLIGTKTAYLSVIATFILILAYCIFFSKGKRKIYLKNLVQILLIALVLFLIIMLFVGSGKLLGDISATAGTPAKYAEESGDITLVVLNGRELKLAEHRDLFDDGGIRSLIFGMGRSYSPKLLEMDFLEVFFYYGIVGVVSMLWLYAYLAVDFLRHMFKKFTLVSFGLFTGLGLAVGYAFIAGHVLFTVTSGLYCVMLIAVSRLYFAENENELEISPRFLKRIIK